MTSLTFCGRNMYQLLKHKPTNLQEDVMNKKQMVLAALMLGAITNLSQAQTFFPALKNFSAADKERLDKNYARSLNFPNDGTVESALANVTMLKLDLPTDEFPMIMETIDNLADHASNPVIRYKACLAAEVFAHPEKFKEVTAYQFSDPDAFFSTLYTGMTRSILSAK